MADRWRVSITGSAEAIARQAAGLEQTAESYRRSDRSIAESLSSAGSETVGQASSGAGSIRGALG